MSHNNTSSGLAVLPFALPDCVIDGTRSAGATLLIDAHTTAPCQRCPACDHPSTRVHSHYLRLVHDLPIADRPVRLLLRVRRFFCDEAACPKRTFAERLPALVPFRARRTPRLSRVLRALGFATGGAPGAWLAARLHLRASRQTLLRLLRATPPPDVPPPHAIGLDDFALRKGRSYGTIVVDLERRRPVALLPDRTTGTVAAWLQAAEDLAVVARDRYREYANAATIGAPDAVQVVDRFHLLVNAREAIERYVQRIRPELRRLLQKTPRPQTTPPSTLLRLPATILERRDGSSRRPSTRSGSGASGRSRRPMPAASPSARLPA